jgi:lysophospholipase L1-like esterase
MNRQQKILIYSAIAVMVVATAVTAFVVYSKRKLRIKNKNPKKILFVGDSQTAVIDPSGKAIGFTYPNVLKKKLPSGYEIDVMAQVGKSTAWMKSNLPAQLKKKKYDRVYIYGGGNDMTSGVSVDQALANIQSMVNMVNESGADAFVNLGYRIDNFMDLSKLPTTQFITSKDQWIPIIEKRRELQRQLPKKIKGAHFVPVYDLKGLTSDGIHPNSKGHELVANAVYDTIVKR